MQQFNKAYKYLKDNNYEVYKINFTSFYFIRDFDGAEIVIKLQEGNSFYYNQNNSHIKDAIALINPICRKRVQGDLFNVP